MTFQAPAIIKVGAPTVDGGIRISFVTNEITDEEKLKAMKFNGSFGWLLFKETGFKDDEIPKDDAEQEGKTPSARLRSVIFLLWKSKGEQGDFNTFYRQTMEKFIEKIKENLD